MRINISDLSLQRPTWAEIDLDAIQSNILEVKKLAPAASILAVIKADAYGHGAERIAHQLEPEVALFGTATVSEAVALRDAGVRVPVLVLGGMTLEQLPMLHAYDLTPVVHSLEFWNAFVAFAQSLGRVVDVHLKLDTGMGRLGMAETDAAHILSQKPANVRINGLMTHFACADIPNDPATLEQLRRFQSFVDTHGAGIRWIHAANSAAILNYPQSHFNLVRPGLLLYGLSPMGDVRKELSPVLSLFSRISALRNVPKGGTIGYSRSFRAERDTLVATIPIGYSDGLRRRLSNKLDVEIRNHMCRVIGNISMDLCMVDVTEIAHDVQISDLVTLIGPRISAWDWAQILDSIAWETFCLLGSRVPRVYKRAGQIIDVYYP